MGDAAEFADPLLELAPRLRPIIITIIIIIISILNYYHYY